MGAATSNRIAGPSTPERAISRGIVLLLREHTARGPRRARTVLTRELAVVTLADSLTTPERMLASKGHRELVLRTRLALYEAMRAEAIAMVEAFTGRKVAAFLTDQAHEPDVAVLAFVFAAPPRTLRAA